MTPERIAELRRIYGGSLGIGNSNLVECLDEIERLQRIIVGVATDLNDMAVAYENSYAGQDIRRVADQLFDARAAKYPQPETEPERITCMYCGLIRALKVKP